MAYVWLILVVLSQYLKLYYNNTHTDLASKIVFSGV